jgi:hypothetical protein
MIAALQCSYALDPLLNVGFIRCNKLLDFDILHFSNVVPITHTPHRTLRHTVQGGSNFARYRVVFVKAKESLQSYVGDRGTNSLACRPYEACRIR